MDAETLVEAVKEHMRALRSSTDWGIGIAAVVTLYVVAGTQESELEIGNVGITNEAGCVVAAVIYSGVIMTLGIQLLHVEYLLRFGMRHVDDYEKHGIKIVAPIVAFPWFFNPFGYYGYTKAQRMNCAFGCFSLVLAWWLGFIGLSRINTESVSPFIIFFSKLLMFTFGFFVVYSSYLVSVAICDILTDAAEGAARASAGSKAQVNAAGPLRGTGAVRGRDRYEDTLLSRLVGLGIGQLAGIAFYVLLPWPADNGEGMWHDVSAALVLLPILGYFLRDQWRRKKEWSRKREPG